MRPRRRALLDRLLPELAISDPPEHLLNPSTLFGADCRRFEIEIGFGGGEHLAAQAEARPDVGFIGCEAYINGVAHLLSLIDAHELTNIRIWPDDARQLLPALKDGTISQVFVLFPDPWPKPRHAKRRLISGSTLDALARVMSDGAELQLASDDMGYIRWSLMHLVRHRDFRWCVKGPADWRRRPADRPATRYELKALGENRRPAYLTFSRQPRRNRDKP